MCSKPIYDGPRVRSLETFIMRSRWKHGEKYDYSKVSYKNSDTPVTIICPKHGEFCQAPKNHINSGCRKCAHEYTASIKKKRVQQDLIKSFRETHGDTYDYSEVEYSTTNSRITIICPHHGKFEQYPYAHKRGSGCPSCGAKMRYKSRREKRKETLVAEFQEVHGNEFDYSEVLANFTNVDSVVPIICKEHGMFYITPTSHLCGVKGCRECANRTISDKRKASASECVERIRERNKKAKDYIFDESTITEGMNSKATITCTLHNVQFKQRLEATRSGIGCPQCAKESIKKKRQHTTEQFIENAKSIHGEDRYSYECTDYKGNREKVIVTCPSHGNFTIGAASHINGSGCPHCAIAGNAGGLIKRGEDGRKGNLYIIRLSNDSETFIKVGISSNARRRISVIRWETHMDIEEILIEDTTIYKAALMEREISIFCHESKYKPALKFGGHTECYCEESLDGILDIISSH